MARAARSDGRLTALMTRLDGPRDPVLPRRQVLDAIGRAGLEHAVADGTLTRVLPGWYCLAAHADDHRVRCAAVVRWSRGALVITGRSALHLLDSRFPAPHRVEARSARHGHVRTPAWLRVTYGEPVRWRITVGGVTCLVSDDAVLDAWCIAAPPDRETVFYTALWLRAVSPRQLRRAADRRARVADRRSLVRLLDEFDDGATSPTEVLARRRVFVGHEFAELEAQVSIRAAGRTRIADLLHRRARLVIELDGSAYHDGPEQVARDRARDAELLAAGYATVRFGFRELMRDPDRCRTLLRAAISSRLGRT
ncbi:DUF559 domain-containing protein [Demequina sp. SYSU T00068]|uniref:endonuclease domain-containing protein n=1 Tax=Demequina lignilytica TaxID=3051663 RepID=UPI0026275402|nr:DUF559 domain-containing protein [Demequina sp. SYSU T00068]MDN4489544.1 DUF559 domain-containing protein [Demequina sp. SYSU T00068]